MTLQAPESPDSSPTTWPLDGRLALITVGSSSGGPLLGDGWPEAVAGALAGAGADVAVAGPDGPATEPALDAVRASGRRAIAIRGNLESESEIATALASATRGRTGLHVLVNAPRAEFFAPASETSAADWDAVQRNVVRPTFIWCREAGRLMSTQGGGSIVNIIGGLARRGMINASAFAASQAAIEALTRSLALEWARNGVRVNAIGASWFESSRRSLEEQRKERPVRYLPLRRKGHPNDAAALALYLASDASAFVTGETIYVDGGAMAHA